MPPPKRREMGAFYLVFGPMELSASLEYTTDLFPFAVKASSHEAHLFHENACALPLFCLTQRFTGYKICRLYQRPGGGRGQGPLPRALHEASTPVARQETCPGGGLIRLASPRTTAAGRRNAMHIPVGFVWRLVLLGAMLISGIGPAAAAGDPAPDATRPPFRSSFTLFESGQVRPLALSPDGSHLFAVNTPDNRLEIFRVRPHGLQHIDSVPVGLEPVAVAVRSHTEVWVVNHLSDSVSVVNVHPPHARRVMQTLLVGDEPRDIVFAGPRQQRAFITTAHRGQNAGRRGRSTDPNTELTTPGVGRADVWVFDADHVGTSLGGDPLTVLTLFTDTPRALAATPDGTLVYAAGFQTGNQTTSHQ